MICSVAHIEYLKNYAIEKGFWLPDGFEDTPLEVLAGIYNGIGAEWLPVYARKFLTKFLFYMEPESLPHDFEFIQKNKSYWKFTLANFRAFVNAAKDRHPLSGLVFAIVCQTLGWSAWKEGKETMAWHYYLGEEQQ